MNTPSHSARAAFALGDVRVEPDRNALITGDEILRLEPKVMDVLVALATAGGEVVSRDALIDSVWAVDFGGDESVSRAISLLRKALKEARLGERAIETVTKRGYRLTIPAGTLQDSPPSENVRISAKRNARKLPLRTTAAIAVAVAVAALVALLFHWTAGSTPAERPVVAVLPFDDLSPGGDYAWFAEGLADELIDNLARVDGIVVIGRTSSFRYGHTDLDARTIGDKLGARYLIEGGVRRDGEKLRVSAAIVDTRDQAMLWSETYERANEHVFDVQADLARAIVRALNARMAVRDPAQLIGTKNPAAFDAFLMGRAYLRAEGPENILRAADQFRRATDLDPDYLHAWLGLEATLSVYDFWHPDKLKEAQTERAAALEKAVRLAPDDQGLKMMQAWIKAANGDISGADRLFQKSFRVPGADHVLQNIFKDERTDECTDRAFVEILLYGRINPGFAKCLVVFREQDTLDLSIAENNQFLAHLIGRDDIAKAEFDRSLKIPGGPGVGEIYAFLRAFAAGDKETARAHFRSLIDFMPAKTAEFEQVYESFDDPARVRDILNNARVNPANQDPTRLVMIAKLLAIYDDPEGAADALRRHFLEAGGTWWQELWMPEHAKTRQQAAFREIIRRLGFEKLFRETGEWNDFCRPVSDVDFECF